MLRGEGPVKHYVESFFTDYPTIREGRGVLDDWATPLDAYVLAGAFRLAGLEPCAVARDHGRRWPRRAASCSTCSACRHFTASRGGDSAATSGSGRWPCWRCCRSMRSTRGSCSGRAWSRSRDSGGLDPDRGLECGHARPRGLGAGPCWRVCAAGWRSWRGTRPWHSLRRPGCTPCSLHGPARTRAAPALGRFVVAVILPWAWATFHEYGEPFYSLYQLL